MPQLNQASSLDSFTLVERLALLTYTSVYYLILPFLLLHWLFNWILRKTDFDQKRLSRFGIYHREVSRCDLMIHCVSVGEVAVAATLVKKLLAKNPQIKITLTTTTPTGAKNVKNLLAQKVQHVYLPFDTGWLMSKLLSKLQPKRILVVEVELWPNLIRQCTKRHIPINIINARMTHRSVKSYHKLSALVNPMIRSLDKVCAQAQRDYDNYHTLGMSHAKLINAGNIKFELAASDSTKVHPMISSLKQSRRPIVIAGSTHDPEEKVLLRAIQQIQQHVPNVMLILVPRHPQRFDKVNDILSQSKLSYCRWSAAEKLDNTTTVLLVDQMGLLMALYECADIAFVGGSIADRGGHNALEPASLGLPVLMGPNQYNNPEICNVLREKGNLKEVSDAAQVAQQCQLWFSNGELRKEAGQAGINVISENRGALEKTIDFLSL